MKKGHFDSKKGGNGFFPKNWNQILRPAINEWRPKKYLLEEIQQIMINIILNVKSTKHKYLYIILTY